MTRWQPDGQGTFFDADYDEDKGLFTHSRCVDIAPVINENLKRQSDPQNGFFKETRDSRQIGDIPAICYYRDVMPKFKALEAKGVSGEDLRVQKGKILRDYLTVHPEFMVVNKLVHHTVNETSILVK